jgi:predicted dehydrogenase
MAIERAVLIGFGHHGRNRLFRSLVNTEQLKEILVYDISTKATDLMEKRDYGKDVTVLTSSDSLYRSMGPDSLVVIGTTAKDHLDLFREAVRRGAKYIYLEKPLAQSLADSYEIADLAAENNVKVAVGFFNDFFPLTPRVKALGEEFGLGPLVKMSSEGGAACLSTCGLHVIDLAGLLFGSPPKEVYGKITSRIENPRGKDYFTFGGVVHALYEGGGELVLSYNNRSIVGYDITLTFEYGMIRTGYDDECITIYGFDEDHSSRPKYRYANPKVLKQIPNTYDFNGLFDTIFHNFLNGGLYCGIERTLNDMQVLLGAMISDSKGSSLSLPIGRENGNFRDRYQIT